MAPIYQTPPSDPFYRNAVSLPMGLCQKLSLPSVMYAVTRLKAFQPQGSQPQVLASVTLESLGANAGRERLLADQTKPFNPKAVSLKY